MVPFGQHLRKVGFDDELSRAFGHMKLGPNVVYPMPPQMRAIIDANAVGETRVFGIEGLAADPLFVWLTGGTVASIDTFYRDLKCFDAMELLVLESLMAKHGLSRSQLKRHPVVHLDIDTTVEPLFGKQEGAEIGHNPRYHKRPSYQPLLSAIAETRTCVGACLRPGNESFGAEDAPTIREHVRRVKPHLRRGQRLVVRIDAAGDCTETMSGVEDEGALFVTKAKLTRDLKRAIYETKTWRTVDWDEEEKPLRQVAEVNFSRKVWNDAGRTFRVVAIRTREDLSGKQVYLWPDLDFTVKAYITNDFENDADFIAREYEDRAEVEVMIREWKYDLGIGEVPTSEFDANHAMLLLKLLTHNLVRGYIAQSFPSLLVWRLAWLRRVLFCVPGRLLKSGNGRYMRLPPDSPLQAMHC